MDEEALRELVEESFQLAEMAKHPGWAYVQQHFAKAVETLSERVLAGRLDDLAEYKLVAGEIRGIQRVLDLPAATNKRVEAARGG